MRLARTITVAAAAAFIAAAVRAQSCGTWSIVPTPNPHPVQNSLSDATPMPNGGVVALGFGFLLEWGGSDWNVIPYPDYTNVGDGVGQISGIGTTLDGHLWGVGIVGSGLPFNSIPLVAHWDGAEWDMIDMVPLMPQTVWPFAERNGHAVAVTGASADDVWVTGGASGFGDGVSASDILMLHWDGSEWTEHFPPAPGVYQNNLWAMAAVASDDVWAVGEILTSPSGHYVLIEHWDGTSWSVSPSPGDTMNGSFLQDVVAIGPNDVWAVGHRPGGPLFMHWNGSEWTVHDAPAGATAFAAYNVTAIASDDVWAASDRTERYHWDGTAWSLHPTSEIPGYDDIDRIPGLVATGPCEVWSFGGRWLDGEVTTFAERLQPPTFGAGDTNADGVVNVIDLIAVITAWGPCPGCPEDVDGDGVVNVNDLVQVILNWG